MKRIFEINKMKITACLVFSMLVSSCNYDEKDQIAGKGDNYIRLITTPDADSGFFISIAGFDATPSTNTFLEVRRDAVTNADLNTSVTATFVIDNTIVDDYNATYVVDYNAAVDEYNADLDVNDDGIDDLEPEDYIDNLYIPDPSTYNIPSTTVTFAPGESVQYIPMDLTDPATLGFVKGYALGVRLQNPSGNFKISEAGKETLVRVVIKNQWDGVYAFGPGNIERFTAGAPNEDDPLQGDFKSLSDRSLETLGPNSVSFSPLWATGGGVGGIDGTFITVDPNVGADGKMAVTMASATNATLANIPGEENSYDPATKTFKLAFAWGTANRRNFRTTLKYKGSR
jgi:hypothetical protein